tara:strand:- start:469 stop:1329 length:861 start_codon:yes stop_codon:yes gene_type:complete
MAKMTDDYPGKEITTDTLKQQLIQETEVKKTEDSKFPTEVIDLPSEGKLYPEGHPLRTGQIEMKYMTAKEEDILTSQNLIQKGVVIDMLLRSLIISNGAGERVNYDDLLLGDKNAVMVAARVLGYGSDYPVEIPCPKCQAKQTETVDLAGLENKDVDIVNDSNTFEFVLPLSKKTLTFKLLSHSDEEKIQAEVKRMKKKTHSSVISYDLTSRLKQVITAVDGDETIKAINNFVENEFISRDSLAFRNNLEKVTPDVDMSVYFECDECGHEDSVNIPMTVEFFWPRS